MRKMGAKTLVKEYIKPNEEIENEFEDIQKRIGNKPLKNPVAIRLSFFSSSCPDKKWRELPESSFLGYAIILKVNLPTDIDNIVKEKTPSGDLVYILEAVTHPPAWTGQDKNNKWELQRITNYYLHCWKEFKTTIGTRKNFKEFSVTGSFFCQQNSLTHVCAHAALRMALNTGEGLIDHKLTNRELNKILGIDHESNTVDKGLSPEQIKHVAKRLDLNVIAGDLREMPTVDYAEYIYPLVESGYPVLISFWPTHHCGHIIPVIGHTMNSDKWDCEAHLAYRPEAFGTYHASAAWVDHFIINDDNFGMYTCMPPSYLRNKMLPQYDATQRAAFVISFVPENINVPPYFAEKAAVQLISSLSESFSPDINNKWLKRLWEQVKLSQKGIVARTLICRKKLYINNIMGQNGIDSNGNGPISTLPRELKDAPEIFWVTEISLPDLYTANKHKLADILTDAKAEIVNNNPTLKLIWGWIPGIQIITPTNPTLNACNTWPITGHVPIIRPEKALGPYKEW